jgi:hypothetical protein
VAVQVCAYANNQHKLDAEISGGSLAETSFALVMQISRGTVSVVDKNGTSWSRIWCGALAKICCSLSLTPLCF